MEQDKHVTELDLSTIDTRLREIAGEWCPVDKSDKPIIGSAMLAFSDGKEFSTDKLMAEINEAIKDCKKSDVASHDDLNRLSMFVLGLHIKRRAKLRLTSAIMTARDAGVNDAQIVAWVDEIVKGSAPESIAP